MGEAAGIDRRQALKGGVVAAGVAWAAPAILTTDRASAQFSPGNTVQLYLRDPASTLPGSMSLTAGSTLREKTILKDGATVLAQSDTTKYHAWSFQAPAGGITINGTVQLALFARGTVGTGNNGITAAVYNQATNTVPTGGSPTLVGTTGTAVWTGTASGQRTVSFGVVSTTIAAGRWLVLKVVNRDNISVNDWIAQWDSAAQNSRLILGL